MSGSVEIRCERNGASRKPSENRLVSQNVVISRSFVTVCLHVKIKMLLPICSSRKKTKEEKNEFCRFPQAPCGTVYSGVHGYRQLFTHTHGLLWNLYSGSQQVQRYNLTPRHLMRRVLASLLNVSCPRLHVFMKEYRDNTSQFHYGC